MPIAAAKPLRSGVPLDETQAMTPRTPLAPASLASRICLTALQREEIGGNAEPAMDECTNLWRRQESSQPLRQ